MMTKTWPIAKFVEYEKNPRKNDHAVQAVANAINEFGFRVPIIALSDGTVIDGHLRLKAARFLKMKEVPVVLVDDMTPVQIKAFRISINKVAELADWDFGLLSDDLKELDEMDFDLSLIGFSDDEIDDIQIGEPKIREKTTFLKNIKYTRILISIPTDDAAQIGDKLDFLNKIPGVEIDYDGN